MFRYFFICFVGVFVALWAQIATAVDLTNVSFDTDQKLTSLRLDITSQDPPTVFFIAEGTPRVVIDIKNGALDDQLLKTSKDKKSFEGEGAVDKIRFAKRGENDLRLVADLNPNAQYLSNSFQSGILLIVIENSSGITSGAESTGEGPNPRIKPGANDSNVAVDARPVIPETRSEAYVDDIPVPRLKTNSIVRKYRKPVIVIDPGHGGYDPGSIGVRKVKEEDVTLAAALELRRQLLATGRYNVVLTRRKDVYIAHEKRVLIARKAGANLFISIHADSTSRGSARGASVYTLADRAQKRSQKLISTQNWILDIDLNDQSEQVGDILVDLAQRKTLTKSAQFADMLLPELSKYSALVGNSHRRAGYYVLLAPDVPAVLLEMGFLSNPQDERLINSPAHRKNLMKAVTTAINSYFQS
ncbi:MAG: AMIN domain-containing protein [Hyphomonadaceae bacterium]|nr:AMIN domain-containing protein [Hyphomonadaceae bacterium]